MKYNFVESTATCRLEVRATERDSFTEFHVTATVIGAAPASVIAERVFNQIAATIAERKIQVIQEKCYGLSAVSEEVLAWRDACYRRRGIDRSIPVTWLEGRPLEGCDFVGVQLWGVTPSDGTSCVQTVENPATGRGRLWTGRGFRMLHLAAVRGTLPDGSMPAGAAEQAQEMFNNVGLGLHAHGLSYRDIRRTWIYVSRLLEWYGDLNRVRTAHYRRNGLGVEGGPAFPASTGIQCHSNGEECLVDVLAVATDRPGALVAEPIVRSPRQDSSFNYGSAFSRGMTFDIEGRRTVHISGTASINSAGASVHVGDPEMQSLETLMCIASILEAQGGSLQNITSATLFCKDRAAWEAWNRVCGLLKIPAFPKICVIADVCRDDLLVEMEAVATI